MSGTDIAAIIGAAGVFLGIVGKGFSWTIGLLTTQFKETIAELKTNIAELKTTIKDVTTDRDEWKARALNAEARLDK